MRPDTGLRSLAELLALMEPKVRPGEFVMVTTSTEVNLPAQATVIEDEGTTLVLGRHTADAFRLDYSALFAWITLTVNSSLEAVGLTAAVTAALAARGISCNVLAGYHHDHLLVPLARLGESLEALRELSAS